MTDDGHRASRAGLVNKPELVFVVESPVSEAQLREMFAAVDAILRENPEVGACYQTL